MAQLAGLSEADIGELTLRQWIDALTPASYRNNQPPAVAPWINAVGIDQAQRRHRALPFCPACLDERGIALKRWRLAFHTWCDVHERTLIEACPRCSAAFVPHLARGSLAHCHRCGGALRVGIRAPNGLASGARGLQARMDGWLAQAAAGDLDARDRLCGLRVVISVGLLGHSGRAVSAATIGAQRVEPIQGRLEIMSLHQRLHAMQWLSRVVDDWPQSFRALAEVAGLSQRSFARSPTSGWLLPEVDRLPCGRARRRGCDIERIAVVLRAPDGIGSVNWRARRAEVLMRRAMSRGH